MKDIDYFKKKFINPVEATSQTNPMFLNTLHDAGGGVHPLEEGVISEVNPKNHTVNVDTDNGTIEGCRIMTPYLTAQGGGTHHLPTRGTHCLVYTLTSQPIVMGYFKETDSKDTPQDTNKISGITCGTAGYGGQDPTYANRGSVNFRQGATDELAPGDHVVNSDEGNLLAILKGLSVLKGGEGSQIIMASQGGFFRQISQLYEHIHSAGVTRIINDNGKCTLTFKAGAFVRSNGEVDELFHLDVGAKGDIVRARITQADGTLLASAKWNSDGSIYIDTSGGTVRHKGNLREEVTGQVTRTVSGETVTNTGNYQYSSQGSTSLLSSGNFGIRSLGNVSLSASGDMSQTILGRKQEVVRGDADARHLGFLKKTTVLKEILFSVLPTPASITGTSYLSLKPSGDLKLYGAASATIGGKAKTTVTGLSVVLGDGLLPDKVVRTGDLIAFSNILLQYISTTSLPPIPGKPGEFTLLPLPPPVDLAIQAAIGSNVVKAN